MLVRRILRQSYQTSTRKFMIFPMIIGSSPPPQKEPDTYPDPKTAKALIKSDIIHGGNIYGNPQYMKYVYDLDTQDDIAELQNLNQLLNYDIERWYPKHIEMKKHKTKNNMSLAPLALLLSSTFGVLTYMILTPSTYSPGVIDVILGSTTGLLSTGGFLVSGGLIYDLISVRNNSTPEEMMTDFRESYHEALDEASKLKSLHNS